MSQNTAILEHWLLFTYKILHNSFCKLKKPQLKLAFTCKDIYSTFKSWTWKDQTYNLEDKLIDSLHCFIPNLIPVWCFIYTINKLFKICIYCWIIQSDSGLFELFLKNKIKKERKMWTLTTMVNGLVWRKTFWSSSLTPFIL